MYQPDNEDIYTLIDKYDDKLREKVRNLDDFSTNHLDIKNIQNMNKTIDLIIKILTKCETLLNERSKIEEQDEPF